MIAPRAARFPLTAEAVLACLGIVLATGCGSRPIEVPVNPSPTLNTAQQLPLPEPSPTAAGGPEIVASATPTVGAFVLDLTPLPTQTALPALALPTVSRFAGSLEAWDGVPTYPADSQPGFYFRVRYDPAAWANIVDAYGSPALANRTIAACLITPTSGRGLPLNGEVEHQVRRIGGISFQVNTASVNGIRQFVNYVGGDGVIYTAFQVSFADSADQCLSEAETVLGTLKAVAVSEATPIP